MGRLNAYDESVLVEVIRNGERRKVMFCEVQDGDYLSDCGDAVVDGDAHLSGDATYEGWLFYDTDGNDYYPEDFGAELREGN